MKKNILILILMFVFICLGLSTFLLVNKANDIEYENSKYIGLEDVSKLDDINVNAVLHHHGISPFVLWKLTQDELGNYYCLYSSEYEDDNYLIYMSKYDYEKIIEDGEIEELKGTIRIIDKKVENNILKNNGSNNKVFYDKDDLYEYIDFDFYLDAVNIDYKSNFVYLLLFYGCLFIGIIGVVVCLILLIIFNRKNIISFFKRHGVSKIIFMVSFIPYIVLLGISFISMFTGVTFIFDTYYGIDAFKLAIILLFIVFWPVLLIVFLYQIIYLIIAYTKRKKINE